MAAKNDKKAIWIIKLGSSLVASLSNGVHDDFIARIAQEVMLLRKKHHVVLVSSGAVAIGMLELGWKQRPCQLYKLQMAASVGQTVLMHAYQKVFAAFDQLVSQLLLVQDDFSNRKRYLNAKSTITGLLQEGVLPIVNENDVVSFEEIRFGDNDNLSAMLAGSLGAKKLIILTNQKGLYDADPRENAAAALIPSIRSDSKKLLGFAGGKPSLYGSGGMLSKVLSARLAGRVGIETVIASGLDEGLLACILEGEPVGTRVSPAPAGHNAKKIWLVNQKKHKGVLFIDAGASQALLRDAASLLSIGVVDIEGAFERGDLVACKTTKGELIAQGIINYPAQDVLKIMGKKSNKILSCLGYENEPELIGRNNMAVFN